MTEDDQAEVLALVLTLAAGPEPVGWTASPVGWRSSPVPYCVLCDAEPPGTASTLTISQHHETCPYRQAVQLTERWARG